MTEDTRHTVEWSTVAAKTLKRLPKEISKRLLDAADALAIGPPPHGCKKMEGSSNKYRIREGNYRLVYALQDERLMILVLKVGHRKDVYK